VYSGRLHSSKALPVLLRAVSRARATVPHLHVFLAGSDSDQGLELRRLATEMGLASAVHFTGLLSRPRLASVLCASDAVALTPYPGENFGNACVEAMGLGLPAILSDNVGAAERAAEDGAAMVTPVDADAIAQAIVQLAADPEMHQRMARAAADSVRNRYSPQAVAPPKAVGVPLLGKLLALTGQQRSVQELNAALESGGVRKRVFCSEGTRRSPWDCTP